MILTTILTTEQKDWLGQIKDKLKLGYPGMNNYIKVKDDPKGGKYFTLTSEVGKQTNDGWDSGFSYIFNRKEDFNVIMNSI